MRRDAPDTRYACDAAQGLWHSIDRLSGCSLFSRTGTQRGRQTLGLRSIIDGADRRDERQRSNVTGARFRGAQRTLDTRNRGHGERAGHGHEARRRRWTLQHALHQ